jgi:hypothetical protein
MIAKVVHSSPYEEELMDHAVLRFRQAADRENGGRPVRRRYSAALQDAAVAYWRTRPDDEGVRTIAAALGVSVSTLQRWTRGLARRPRFRRVEIVAPEPTVASSPAVVVQITATGPRVEGLTVETAARLLTLLR